MRSSMTAEQRQKHANMVAFASTNQVGAWALPEATRPLGDTSALAAWIACGRAVPPGA
jgi:hypothetical protein